GVPLVLRGVGGGGPIDGPSADAATEVFVDGEAVAVGAAPVDARDRVVALRRRPVAGGRELAAPGAPVVSRGLRTGVQVARIIRIGHLHHVDAEGARVRGDGDHPRRAVAAAVAIAAAATIEREAAVAAPAEADGDACMLPRSE